MVAPEEETVPALMFVPVKMDTKVLGAHKVTDILFS